MRTTVFALHGYTLNGAVMRSQMAELAAALAPDVDLECPDAPHTCDPVSVDRLYASREMPRHAPPHLSWWDASDDGSVYRGWERTRDAAREWAERSSPVGLVGFSQGAMLAATIAALSSAGELPALCFVVLIAGRMPRAHALKPWFERTIAVPSLHVWGERDRLTGSHARALVDRFDPVSREIARWPGPHAVPKTGPAADAIVDFVRRRAQSDGA